MLTATTRRKTDAEESRWREGLLEGRIENPQALAAFLLAKVSRTFALNIQVLPPALRYKVLLAYLFCRMADTIEDEASLPVPDRVDLLGRFASLFGEAPEARVEEFVRRLPPDWARSERWDHLLLYHSGWIFGEFRRLDHAAAATISRCVVEMSTGMAEFVKRQSLPGVEDAALIETLDDLDKYCYFVAGTVGIMLCELFAGSTPLIGRRRFRRLKSLSVSFGLGLQMTNILKDIREDRRRNVSYIPLRLLREKNLSQTLFLLPERSRQAKQVLRTLIGKTRDHLEDALEYSCLLPRLEPRLRLFCLWPLFMAVETLVVAARDQNAIRPGAAVKIGRRQVEGIVRLTGLTCWSNTLLRRLFRRRMATLDSILANYDG